VSIGALEQAQARMGALASPRKKPFSWATVAIHGLLIACIAVVVFPLYFAFAVSTQNLQQVVQQPPRLLPSVHALSNYAEAWDKALDYLLKAAKKTVASFGIREALALYEEALAVYYGPFDEDYGYVTLEGFAADRPVVTLADSGGPLEFVADGQTGLVAAPEPKAIADAFDRLFVDRELAARLGAAGNALVRTEVPRWPDVVARLLD